jgi:hypothetical protein
LDCDWVYDNPYYYSLCNRAAQAHILSSYHIYACTYSVGSQ